MKKKICVVTATRAEYGLLYWILKEIQSDCNLELQLIVTGTHLSPEFGMTIKEIENEFVINKTIEILMSSDTSIGISKTMALAQISISEALSELNPDIVLLLGDRSELLSAAAAALIARIPIAHIHGGETTEGAYDEAIRHSITKMSHLHFATTEKYKQRIIQLGEDPKTVFNFGAPGLDNLKKLPLLGRKKIEKKLKLKFNLRNILVAFHPITLQKNSTEKYFSQIIEALNGLKNTNLIFTKSNADVESRIINSMIDDYVSNNRKKSISFHSLGQINFLSCIKNCDIIIGNSSSGIIEAPSLRTATIDIGDRQKGRIRASSVISCSANKEEILQAINRVYTTEFSSIVKLTTNPYYQDNTSKKIVEEIKRYKFSKNLIKKFYDCI